MSILIKRYPNRKLYDTTRKQYITLDKVCDLIRQGEELTVIENVSGEDMTAVVLSQVILENEKNRSGHLPGVVLAGLIQSGNATLEIMRRGMMSPFSNTTKIDDEIKKRVDILVETGELTMGQAEDLINKLLCAGQLKRRRSILMEKVIHGVFGERGIASREELSALSDRVEALSVTLDRIIEIKHNQKVN